MADIKELDEILRKREQQNNFFSDSEFPNAYANLSTEQLQFLRKETQKETMKALTGGKEHADIFDIISSIFSKKDLTDEQKRKADEVNAIDNELRYRNTQNTNTAEKIANVFGSSIIDSGNNMTDFVRTVSNKTFGTDFDLTPRSLDSLEADYYLQNSKGLENVALGVTRSIGQQVLPAMTLGIGKAAPYMANFANFSTDSYKSALKEGKTEDQALKYGLVSGALETGLQAILGSTLGNIYQKSGGSTLVNNVTKKLVKNDAIRNYLSEIISEGGEEYLQEILSPIVRNITLDENNEFKLFSANALYAGLLGGITAGIMGGASSISNFTNNTPIDNMNVTEATNFLEGIKSNTTDPIVIQKLDNAVNELQQYQRTTITPDPTISTFKTDIDTQLRVKQRALQQLESRDVLLRTESEQAQIDNLKTTIAELRKQKANPVLRVETKPLTKQSMTQKYMDKVEGKKHKNKEGYDYTIPTLYRGTNDTNISRGVARFGEGTYYTPSEKRAETYGTVSEYIDLSEDFKNPYIQGTSYNDKMINLLKEYRTTHPELANKIDTVLNNGMPLTNTIIPQQDIKQMYLEAGYDSFIGGTTAEPEYVSYKETIESTEKSPEQVFNETVLETYSQPKENKTLDETVKKDVQMLVDKNYPIEVLAKQTDNKELVNAHFMTFTADARTQFDIDEYLTDLEGKRIGKGLNEIFKNVEEAGLEHEFGMYMYAKHGIDRYKQEKYIFGEDITPEMLRNFVNEQEQLHPEFKEYSKDVLDYEKNLRNIMVDSGIISEETQKLLEEMYPNYVRIFRENNNNTSPYRIEGKTLKVNSPVKTAKGGSSPVQPLKIALAKQTAEVNYAALRNNVGKALARSLKSENSAFTDVVNNIVSKGDNHGFIYYDNGKQKVIPINKALYDALKPSQKYDWEDMGIFKAISKVSSIQRRVLTQDNPVFAVTNFFKDTGDAGFNSKYGLGFYTTFNTAVDQMIHGGTLWELYKANGGYQTTQFTREQGFTNKKGFLGKVESLNNMTEQLPRFMEFIATIEHGGSIYEAMYNSMEVTTNFNRGSDITRALSRNGFNFLNASVQGMYKQYNNLRGANGVRGYAQLATKAAILGVLPAMLNHLLLNDDEDYQDLPTYIKDGYYLFKIGDDKFVKIPKARMMGILGNAARRTLSGESFDDFGKLVIDQIGPNNPLKENIFAPIMQVSENKSWNGYDIVPSRLQDLKPSEQYDAGTTELAKTIGKIFNYSPMKIDYLIDQYSGVVGDITMPMMTEEADPNWLVGKFVVDAVMTNDNTNRLYEEIANLKKEEVTEDTKVQSKYLNSTLYYVNMYYSQIRAVQGDTTLTDKEKTEQVRALKSELNSLAKQALELKNDVIEKTYKSETYKQIGLQLYKYDKENDEYKKVNTGTKTYRDILGYKVQSEVINQELDGEGKLYTKVGSAYYEIKEDGTYDKLTSSSAINKAKIKLGY